MAKVVYFKRVREDATQVEYAFGRTRDTMDRRLVADKATKTFRPVDSPVDGQFSGAVTQIGRQLDREGSWPESGLLQA